MSNRGILSDVRVVDCGDGLAASMCGMLLAEAGADVIKVEPIGGAGGRGTAWFAVANRSKRSIALDYLGENRSEFDGLLRKCDVLLHDLPAQRAREVGLDAANLAGIADHLLLCHIDSFPEGHADQTVPADDILVLAAGGFMDEQPAIGRSGPTYLRFPLGSLGAAWLAATGVMSQLVLRARGGRTSAVATSLFQGALLPTAMLWHDAEFDQASLDSGNAKSKRPSMFRCADGVWLHLMHNPDHLPLMQEFFQTLGPEGLARANAEAGSQRKFPNFGANILAFLSRPSGEWLEALWAGDVPAQPALAMGEIYRDAQAIENGYVVTVDDPELGKTFQPGPPIVTSPPARVRSPAPKCDADRHWALSLPDQHVRQISPQPLARPLAGLKVLDFGVFLAGPLTAMLLADLGADVIKIESIDGDPMRGNASAFMGCHRGKRAIALNLKHADARPVLARLVAGADIVHHNLRMPAAERLGLGYASLSAINPQLIYSHVNSYGPAGSRKDWPGYDQMFQALCGWEVEGAGKGNPPTWFRFGMMDHQCACASLFATLLGLLRREQTGQGSAVTASLLGASLMTISETVMLADGRLTPIAHLDPEQTGISSGRRIHPCRDGWVAVIGDDDRMPAPASLTGLSCIEVIALVSRLGGTAVPVRTNHAKPFLNDPSHRALGLVAEYRHPHYGRLRQPGAFWSFHGSPPEFDRAPPLHGQDTKTILMELGFDDAEVQRLYKNGAIGSPA